MMMNDRIRPVPGRVAPLLILACLAASPVEAAEQSLAVGRLDKAPVIDGKVEEWGKTGWVKVNVKPAVEKDEKNLTGALDVELKLAISGDRLYVAARWPDPKADLSWKSWQWDGSRYRRGRDEDDKFVLRFELSGDYDTCMLTNKTYEADVWFWSAGRTNLGGMAENVLHRISAQPIEDAAEHKAPNGATVYIKKIMEGTRGYSAQKAPAAKAEESVPSVAIAQPPGNPDDILAKGIWANGIWSLEMSRKLNTGKAGRSALAPGSKVKGAIAVFNAGADEHKSVSDLLLFDLAGR